MGSNAKKKTTFAKMNRENAVREKRLRKQAKREAKKLAVAPPTVGAVPETETDTHTDALETG